MATIDSAQIIRTMLKNDGVYMDDPQPFAIAQYLNNYGHNTWSVCYHERDYLALMDSPHCREIVLFWTVIGGLTLKGKAFAAEKA